MYSSWSRRTTDINDSPILLAMVSLSQTRHVNVHEWWLHRQENLARVRARTSWKKVGIVSIVRPVSRRRVSVASSVEWQTIVNRDCKSGRHILWHCTSSLSWWWLGINLDWDYTWAFKSPYPVLFWPSLKAHNHVPHDVHWCVFSPLTVVKPQWKV